MHQKEYQVLNRKAECCCGNLNIEVRGEPDLYGVCHCDDCKKRTGSAFGISSYFKKDDVLSISGESSQYSFYHQEQNHKQKRHFCFSCGTTLYWYVSSYPELIGVAGGCFVESPLGEPKYSTNHSGKCNWVELGETIEKNA